MVIKLLKLALILIIFFILLIVFFEPKKQAEMPLNKKLPPLEEITNEILETPAIKQVEEQKDQNEQLDEVGEEPPNLNTATSETSTKKILFSVPFTSQAPFGDWDDSRQQDGCEEASVLMAIKWAKNKPLSRETALREITSISDYILNKYGEYRDTDLNDVLNWIIKDYFEYENAELKEDVTLEDLISELKNGRVIIAPMNGQALKNPNFVAPGPINHMLLIRGYDPIKKTFITNDPGTRNGELYEYDENLLYSALRTYPTGYQEANPNPQKNIIVLWQ